MEIHHDNNHNHYIGFTELNGIRTGNINEWVTYNDNGWHSSGVDNKLYVEVDWEKAIEKEDWFKQQYEWEYQPQWGAKDYSQELVSKISELEKTIEDLKIVIDVMIDMSTRGSNNLPQILKDMIKLENEEDSIEDKVDEFIRDEDLKI